MGFTISAACGCNTGKIRKNNEDNFCFDGKHLEAENNGLEKTLCYQGRLKNGFCVAVFDGMGGENYGEYAAYAAAKEMKQAKRSFTDRFLSEGRYLERLSQQLNRAVVAVAKELGTSRMGSTMVALGFDPHHAYACNLGDSRAYRVRNRELVQLSRDHICKMPGREMKKAPLSQNLGIDPTEMLLEPSVAKSRLYAGDIYLLCSDGLTDMLTDAEITDILLAAKDEESCVSGLIRAALEHGGKDNITVIVCRIK